MKIIKSDDKTAIDLACEFLKLGKIISFATDTVYGLAVDASNFKAISNLYKIKKRSENKPIAIFVKDLTAAKKLFFFDELTQKIAEKFLPGAITLVLKLCLKSSKTKPKLAKNLNQNGDGFLGFRIVADDFVKNLLERFDGVLAVTSANPAGKEAAIVAEEVKKYFSKDCGLALLIDGGVSKQQQPSTVVKIFENKLTILRSGAINLSDYESF